jgi:hypothetical protein
MDGEHVRQEEPPAINPDTISVSVSNKGDAFHLRMLGNVFISPCVEYSAAVPTVLSWNPTW